MSDIATEPPASAANTVALSRIESHGSSLEVCVIQHVARNADRVGIATAPLSTGSSCAAAINGSKKNAFRMTLDVQSSGAVRPETTASTDTTATSAASISTVTNVRVRWLARGAVRSAQALQHAASRA